MKKRISFDEVLTTPKVGERCRIKIGTNVYETSPVVDWSHSLFTDSWTIQTQNSIYVKE